MNRTTWTRFLLAASLALNLGIVVAIAIRPSPPRSVAIAVQPRHLNLQDYLELSVEQRTKWQQLEPAFLHELAVNWQGIRQHREALVQQIFATTPNRTAIDAEQAAIAALQAQQQRVIAQLLAERNLLDEQQRKRLMDLLLSRYSQETTEEELLHRD